MTVPLAFATEKAHVSSVTRRRARPNGKASARATAIRRLLRQARQAARLGQPVRARRHALGVLKLDPSNQSAAKLVRESIHRKK
jgi:hypothetical protein